MDTVDNVSFLNFILDNAGLTGSSRRQLARAVDLPEWVLESGDTMVPSNHQLKLWELVELKLDDPSIALRIGQLNTLGRFGLHDYLFNTAPTLAEGLALSEQHAGLITTNVDWPRTSRSRLSWPGLDTPPDRMCIRSGSASGSVHHGDTITSSRRSARVKSTSVRRPTGSPSAQPI